MAYGFSLNELFDNDKIVLSAALHIAKPESAIYQHTLTKFSLESKNVIFIDDSETNIKGALSAGWRAIHFKNTDSCRQALESYLTIDLDPDYDSLNELLTSSFGMASDTAKNYGDLV